MQSKQWLASHPRLSHFASREHFEGALFVARAGSALVWKTFGAPSIRSKALPIFFLSENRQASWGGGPPGSVQSWTVGLARFAAKLLCRQVLVEKSGSSVSKLCICKALTKCKH